MNSITIPVRAALTFDRLLDLNPHATARELASAFPFLPTELQRQALEDERLQVALDAVSGEGEQTP